MPIHDLSYQRWNGVRVERRSSWILGRAQFRALLRRRPVRFALSASVVLTLAWAAAIYLESQLSRLGPLAKMAGGLSIDTAAFHRYLTAQRLLHWLLCVAAADCIALDRRHRALQILLARPVRRRDYVIGKAAGIAAVLSLASWVPAMILVVLKIAVRADVAWLASDPRLVPGVLGYSAVLLLAATLVTLGISSLSSSPRQASAQLFGFLAVSEAVSQVLSALTGRAEWRALSVSADLDQMATWCFGLEPAHDFPPVQAALALVAIGALAALVLGRSVRAVQVVGGSVKPVIVASDLARWYGEVVALSGLELEVGPGVTGLLGANGAGKSTLLKVLTGSLRPNRGAVSILGQPVWDNPALWHRVGFCPESESVYEDWSVLEFLRAMCGLCGVRGAEATKRVERALHLVGLEPVPTKSMAAFSKGMRQRAKLAQALLFDPEVLLLDEPLNGMDPVGRTRTMDLVVQLGQQGRTVLVSSHILPEVESMTRQVALLDHGKLVASGDVSEIRDLIEDRPQSVRLRCRDPHALGARLIGLPDVEGVRFVSDPEVLVVETRKAETFYALLTRLGAEKETGVVELLPLDADLRSVYEYLIR